MAHPTSTETETAARYVELLKAALTHTLYDPLDIGAYEGRTAASRWLWRTLRRHGLVRLKRVDDPERFRAEGRDWPIFAQTMVGRRRLDSLHRCLEGVLDDGVPGDLIETGVWRGGCAILMRGVLAARGDTERVVVAADSFAGLPAPSAGHPQDAGARFHTSPLLAVSRAEVEANFRRYGLLDDQVELLEGWFADTLPTLNDRTWALIRLDGDMYGSTMDALESLYPRLSPGGCVIVDDYDIASCRAAVDDYRARHGITEPLERVDWTGALWRRAA